MTVKGILYIPWLRLEKMFLPEGGYLEDRSSNFYGQLYNQTKLLSGRAGITLKCE